MTADLVARLQWMVADGRNMGVNEQTIDLDIIEQAASALRSSGEAVAFVTRAGNLIGGLIWTDAGRNADLPDGTKLYHHPATPASAWRPIAEAPRDGGLFIGWVAAERWSAEDGGGSGRSADTSDVDFCQWLADSEHPEGGYFVNVMGQIGDVQDITHFQPLPTPPTSTKGG